MKLGKIKTNLSSNTFQVVPLGGGSAYISSPVANDIHFTPSGVTTVVQISTTGISEGFLLTLYWNGFNAPLTIQHGSNIYFAPGVDFVFDSSSDFVTLVNYSGSWYEVNRTSKTGFQGAQGTPGVQGASGEPGGLGPQGALGSATGQPGHQGNVGINSPISGDAGVQGTQGPTGLPGDSGNQGAQGVLGDTGGPG